MDIVHRIMQWMRIIDLADLTYKARSESVLKIIISSTRYPPINNRKYLRI